MNPSQAFCHESHRTKHRNHHVRNASRSSKTQEHMEPAKPQQITNLQRDFRKVIPRPRCAFVTMVMYGEEYCQGAATLAWSLRQQKTVHELVVMVTPDVSTRSQRLLHKLYDRVIRVNYIETKVTSTLRGKKYRGEHRWMKFSLTKAHMLKLTEYDKIAWLDADSLVLENIDCLLELPTPAGICSSIRDHDYWHSSKVPESEIENSIQNNYGVLGCIMVLTPSLQHYLLASSLPEIKTNSTFLRPDGYFFTQLYKTEWNHIHIKYGCTGWYAETQQVPPQVIHFAGVNPWEEHETQGWEGVYKWRTFKTTLLQTCPQLSKIFSPTTQHLVEPVIHASERI